MLKYVILNLLFIATLSGTINYSAKFNPEIKVSSLTTSYKYCNIKRLTNNNFVVLFTDSNTMKLKYQFIDSSGTKLGSLLTLPLYLYANFDIIEPMSNGRFIILFTEYNGGYYLNARIFNNDGITVTQISNITTNLSSFYDIILLVVFVDNGFAALWSTIGGSNFVYRFYDASGNSLTNLITFNDGGSAIYAPVAKAITNTTFMLCYKLDSGGENVKCDILGYSGGTGTPISVYSNAGPSREIMSMSLAKLPNGNYALSWAYLSTYIKLAVIDPSLNIILSYITINDYTPADHPKFVVHANSEYSVFFEESVTTGGISRTEVVYQKFTIYNERIGSNVVLNTNFYEQGRQFPSVVETTSYNLAACWNVLNTGNIYFQLFSPASTSCQYFSLNIKTLTTLSLKNSFTSGITDQNLDSILIYFSSLPSLGALVTSNGSKISTNTAYKYDNINYNSPPSQVSFNITYSIVNSNTNAQSVCTMNLGVCYPTCETCSAIGNSTNHLCNSCSAGYIFQDSNCISACPTTVQGVSYYFNSKNNACNKCLDSCQECTDGVSCTICKTGYLKVQDYTLNNCVTSCPTGYTLTNSTCFTCDFRNSDSSCITCSGSTPYLYQYKCTDSCPSSLYPNTKNLCIDCTNKIVYKVICYDACPEKTFYDETLKTCYTCEDRKMRYYNNTCISNCPVGSSLNKDNVCETCKSQNKYYYDNNCVDLCPFGYIENNSLSECDLLTIQGI
jgi:hypothetical protein